MNLTGAETVKKRGASSMEVLRGVVCGLLISTAVFAQARPEFEVASIRPSVDQGTQAVSVGLSFNGSQVRIAYMSLKDHIGIAYGVRIDQVTGPEWIGQTRFDIAAKMPDGSSTEQADEMLQALLEDRFQLKVHREKKEFPVYALTSVDGGATLTPVADAPEATPQNGFAVAATGGAGGVSLDMGGGSSFTLGNNRLEVRKMPMNGFADVLTRFMDRPVVDVTGSKGLYDLTLELTPEDYTAMMIRSAVGAGIQLPPQALRLLENASADPLSGPLKKYGLKFDARRMPLDVIVVDSVLRTPSEN
jgi:uncharacterized protein (TIGR03435 family)